MADRGGSDEFHRLLDRVAAESAVGDTSVIDQWRTGKRGNPLGG